MSSNNTAYYFDDHNNNNNRNDDDDPFFNFHNNPPQSHGDWNKRILYMAIISLTFVLFLVFALHIYARYVLRRQARRRLAIRRLSLTVAQSMESQNNSSGGLHPSVISTLPTFIFKQKKTREQDQEQLQDDEEECAVCLSGVEDEETVRLLPNCKHTFHVGCIDAWLASHSTCPVCRAKVEPTVLIRRIEPQPREGPIGGAPTITVTAPPLLVDQRIITEGTSEGDSAKTSGASRLSSFRRVLSRERSSRRIQPFSHDGGDHDVEHDDLERQ